MSWNKNEDLQLLKSIGKYGVANWNDVANNIPGKSSSQCRGRWHGKFDPALNNAEWTAEDDKAIIEFKRHYGKQWAQLAVQMPGRTHHAIKNRYYIICRNINKLRNSHNNDSLSSNEHNVKDSYRKKNDFPINTESSFDKSIFATDSIDSSQIYIESERSSITSMHVSYSDNADNCDTYANSSSEKTNISSSNCYEQCNYTVAPNNNQLDTSQQQHTMNSHYDCTGNMNANSGEPSMNSYPCSSNYNNNLLEVQGNSSILYPQHQVQTTRTANYSYYKYDNHDDNVNQISSVPVDNQTYSVPPTSFGELPLDYEILDWINDELDDSEVVLT